MEGIFDQSAVSRILDDGAALGADSTTVPRITSGASSSLAFPPSPAEPHVHVQAVIGADLGARWVAYLRASAPAVLTLKWCHVEGFVQHGEGHEARAVRDGLAEQTIVITDPMDLAREVDVRLHESGRAVVAVCGMLLSQRSPAAANLRHMLERHLLQQSGVGAIATLIYEASCDVFVGGRTGSWRAYSPERMIARCDGNLRRIAKLAAQSTALIVDQRDPDAVTAGPPDWADAVDRFNLGRAPYQARVALRQVGRANIIFDRDEQPITDMVEELRSAAEGAGSYDWLRVGDAPEGSVRTGDDAGHRRLQLADIAAGWASTLIRSGGFLAVATRFRLVLYNGERLILDDAARLDKLTAAHRRLLDQTSSR